MSKILQCQDEEQAHSANLIFRGEYDVPLRSKPKTVLDIGANVGAFAMLARKRWPDARIIACEPMPATLSALKVNTAQDNIEVVPKAIRSFSGPDKIRMGINNSCQCSFKDVPWVNGDTVDVECMDGALLPPADLVKIDTEGCELEILQSLDLSNTQAIALEYHTKDDKWRIKTWLLNLGFHLHDDTPTLNGCGIQKYTRGILQDRLFLAIPEYGSPHTWFRTALDELKRNPPCEILMRQCVGDSLVTRARNNLTADFLETNCSDLLFIDSDLVFSPGHVARILSHDEDVVCGLYPKKQVGDAQWVINALETPTEPREDGLQQIKYGGTGFMRVRRNVFERMKEAADWYHEDGDHHRKEHDFWPVGVYKFPDKSRRYLSEDWYFCQRWLDLGGKVWADLGVVLKHIGWVAYPVGGNMVVRDGS
jgi:FkbM family methyltransferase